VFRGAPSPEIAVGIGSIIRPGVLAREGHGVEGVEDAMSSSAKERLKQPVSGWEV